MSDWGAARLQVGIDEEDAKAGRFQPGSTCVLTLTGHGLRDPESALGAATRPATVPARLDAVLAAMGL